MDPLQYKASKPVSNWRGAYAEDHNKRLHLVIKYSQAEKYFYPHRPPTTIFRRRTSSCLFVQWSHPPRIGPFQVFGVSTTTVTIDQNGTKSIIFFNLGTSNEQHHDEDTWLKPTKDGSCNDNISLEAYNDAQSTTQQNTVSRIESNKDAVLSKEDDMKATKEWAGIALDLRLAKWKVVISFLFVLLLACRWSSLPDRSHPWAQHYGLLARSKNL